MYRKRGFSCSYTQQCWYMATAKINNLKFQIYKSFPNFTCSLEILDTIIISIIYLDALTSQRNNTTWYTTLKYFFGYRIQGVKKSFYFNMYWILKCCFLHWITVQCMCNSQRLCVVLPVESLILYNFLLINTDQSISLPYQTPRGNN